MPLKKPSELFGSRVVEEDNLSLEKKHLNDTSQQVQGSLSKIEELEEKIEKIYTEYPKTLEVLSEKLSNRVTKTDLVTHLAVVDENLKVIKDHVKGLYKSCEIPVPLKKPSELFESIDKKNDIKVTEELNKFSCFLEGKIGEFEKKKEEIKSDVADIKTDVLVYEKHIKDYMQDHKKDIVDLKENITKDFVNILTGNIQTNVRRLENKINIMQEKYDAIKPEEVMQDLKEGLLNIPPDADNSDPLTPLDQNYVTTKQLQDHYRLFINRIQQQLATLGGGGAVNIRDLDDVDISTARVNGNFLKYDSSVSKWIGADSGGVDENTAIAYAVALG